MRMKNLMVLVTISLSNGTRLQLAQAAIVPDDVTVEGVDHEAHTFPLSDPADEGIGYAEAMILQGDRVSPLPPGHTRGGMATREMRGNV